MLSMHGDRLVNMYGMSMHGKDDISDHLSHTFTIHTIGIHALALSISDRMNFLV